LLLGIRLRFGDRFDPAGGKSSFWILPFVFKRIRIDRMTLRAQLPKFTDRPPAGPRNLQAVRLQSLKKPAILLGLFVTYLVVAKLSLKLAFVHPSATLVWPPSGLALAAFVLLGFWVWPAILIGSFLVNLTTAGSIVTSVCIAVGNTLEALLGAYLLKRFAHGRHAFERAPDIFKFAAFAGVLSTAVAATFGVTSLSLGGYASWPRYSDIWLTWWLGDGVGNVVVAPALILWCNHFSLRNLRDRFFEVTSLLACLVIVSEVVFNGLSISSIGHFPLGLLCVPLLIWAAFRFDPRETAVATLVMSGVAIRGALRGLGPFWQNSEQASLLLVQAVTCITSVMALAVAASVSERKRLEGMALHLAAIVESSYDAIIGKTLEGIIFSWNKGAEEMYGYTAAEAIGQSATMLMPADKVGELGRIMASIRRGEVTIHNETARVRNDGTVVHVSLTVSPVRDDQGRIVGASAIGRDITEHKMAESVMRDANQKLKAWVSRLERQTHEIALLNQMIQLLQTCQAPEEVCEVTRQFAVQLFPGDSGAVCATNTAMNLVETVTSWGRTPPVETVFSAQECWALRRGQVHGVHNSKTALLCQHLRDEVPIDSLCVPMMAQGETLGVLQLRREPLDSWRPEDQEEPMQAAREQLAITVAGNIALAFANLRLRDTLQAQSIRDPLTGLYNRRYLRDSLEREIGRAARSQRTLAVILIDVDHFKGLNDTLGHEAGDTLLHELGDFLQSRTRSGDIPCRYGGDEFVIIMADTTLEVAVRRAQQLQEGVKRLSVPNGKEFLTLPTVSLGVAIYPEHGSAADSLLRAADEALYRAKSQGRDRVVVGPVCETE
jgi:diguanylate cyclase (GGDEF)-like protein/PAS domain S-box-containing protein